MRTSFPVSFQGNLLGKSREAGSFTTSDGDDVTYGDAYELAFENSEGLTQTVRCALKALDEAADFDVAKASKFAPVNVLGDVAIGDGRPGSFRPTQVRLTKAA
jgi:hypothetical protein